MKNFVKLIAMSLFVASLVGMTGCWNKKEEAAAPAEEATMEAPAEAPAEMPAETMEEAPAEGEAE